MSSSASPCKAKNRQGKPCGAAAMADRDYCWTHDPGLREQRHQARSQGGRARHGRQLTWSGEDHRPAIRIRTTDDVMAIVERAILHEVTLENSHNRNRTLGYLSMVALKALEVGELEQRLAALEERANGQH
jgi:hypothetical protein